MAKNIISLSETRDLFFADTALIAIVSALPVYKFCWLINKELDINFERVPDSEIVINKKDNKFYYSHYIYQLPDCNNVYRIYNLKDRKHQLLPELKQVDFLWSIQSSDYYPEAINLIADLEKIKDITLAKILPLDQIKSWKHLIV